MTPETPQTPSGAAQPFPENAVLQSMLEQAQAAAAAQNEPTAFPRESQRHEVLLQETDLLIPDAVDDLPPPAYGDVYGEIRDKKDGLDAAITDDGRVNIRINQFNRRLSQIFAPALHQHVQSVQESGEPPLLYIPPSLGGEDGVPPPPPLNVVIQVVGSRGDVQPFVALGRVLKETYGHRVRLATHPNFKSFVQENNLEFFSIGGDPSRLMAFMVKNPSLMPGFRTILSGDIGERRRDVAEYIQGCWRSCYKAGDGMSPRSTDEDHAKSEVDSASRPFVADCIIANPPSFAHIHCAEKLGIPLHIMFTMPYSPTQAFPHPLANIQASNTDTQLTNYISYAMIEILMWQGLGDIINRFREKCLGLDPVSLIWAPGMLQRLKIPHTYCWSPALISKPKDWGPHISISGFYFLNSTPSYTPSTSLQAFLDAGPPPVYIGFGSIVLDDPNAMTELIFEAARKTGQRVLLSKGWGGMGADELRVPDGIFMLGNVPHDWLFKHVSCVVHHGGAGTTAAGITAGRPTVVIPFFGDQLFWAVMVARAGAGPSPIPHKQLTAEKLASAINFCLKPTSLESAKELANKIAAERGTDMGAQSFHQFLEVDGLRCTLSPSRAAAWRIKRTQVRLSPFAACTLANANLLDFHDLKLFRSREYNTDEGPWDPLSGFATGIFGALSTMTMGVADIPSETVKAMMMPFRSSQLKSQAPVSTTRRNSETLLRGESSRNQPTSSKEHDMLSRTTAHRSKGIGRIAKAALQSPMDTSIRITEGFHNAPKLWGDNTVRPQQQVNNIKSGAKAIGKEFAFGFYDGVTGLVAQPWKGAQKEGTSGFLKGVGKGVGGFLTKPGAALFGVPAYLMKGVYKEVQNLFGSNVQNYIVASRTAQGYEDWLQGSEAEKEDVIERWKLIQRHLKKKQTRDDMMRDVLEQQRKKTRDNGGPNRIGGRTSSSTRSASISLGATDVGEPISPSILDELYGEPEKGDDHMEQTVQENMIRLQHQRQESPDHETEEQSWREAIAASEAEAQRHAREELEHTNHLKLAMDQSLREQRQRRSHREWQLDRSLDDEDDEHSGQARRSSENMENHAAAETTSSHTVQYPPMYASSHLAGTTRSQFEALQQRLGGEKTTEEKMEEEIVMAYVAKQSLLEMQHRGKGKARATVTKAEEDEGLQEALKLSMQEHEQNAGYRHGGPSAV
ncbi:putative glucosyl/glucuronosyl transferase [Rhexocercosporidium sp. MPI-PUGE-AT-0058]|nr:putative glucosyl/glucuronosyl transferase [Rhexocercosporidium sp. MPI-PUGE-AT-0058]